AVRPLVESCPEPVGLGLTRGDLLWSVRHEGALDAGDLLDRRTRIGLVAADRERALEAAEGMFG
ncbi:glycerol-3-phosphate dehydrogenase, partial [Nonomuraea ferruginea]|nr:glycerol-3-phosphate dehydrogenase [Nonomuraea ferruginea]